MVEKSIREVLFFILMAVLFYLTVRVAELWIKKGKINPQIAFIYLAIVYASIMAGVYYLANLNKANHEGFWEVSPEAKFKGVNWYNCQGDSPDAKECRKMLSTKEGQCAIASYSCPYGYKGVPKIPFYYTPSPGDNCQNASSSEQENCIPRHDNKDRYTAFERTVPF